MAYVFKINYRQVVEKRIIYLSIKSDKIYIIYWIICIILFDSQINKKSDQFLYKNWSFFLFIDHEFVSKKHSNEYFINIFLMNYFNYFNELLLLININWIDIKKILNKTIFIARFYRAFVRAREQRNTEKKARNDRKNPKKNRAYPTVF